MNYLVAVFCVCIVSVIRPCVGEVLKVSIFGIVIETSFVLFERLLLFSLCIILVLYMFERLLLEIRCGK